MYGTRYRSLPRIPGSFSRISKRYKFYLAFENSNCRYYITEKVAGNALLYVPFVFPTCTLSEYAFNSDLTIFDLRGLNVHYY